MFGQKLKANLVFAFMPRAQAVFFEKHVIFRLMQSTLNITNPEIVDLGYLQRQSKGFSPKVYVTLCENNPVDNLNASTLDATDPNLHITYCHGNTHDLIGYLGAKNVYTEVTKNIENEAKEEFSLTIDSNIFTHIDGFKYNSSGVNGRVTVHA